MLHPKILTRVITGFGRLDVPLILSRIGAGKRKVHVFSMTMGRCGTRSLTGIFGRYRAIHDPAKKLLPDLYVDAYFGRVSREDQLKMLRTVDSILYPEFSAAGYLAYFAELLVEAFPDAKFLLAIRDCYSWLENIIDLNFSGRVDKRMGLREILRRPSQFPHGPAEKILLDRNIDSLESYFHWWATHNQKVLDTIPPDRLLVMRTKDITQTVPRIAEFVGADPSTLVAERSHVGHRKKRQYPLRDIDRDYLESRVNAQCRPLMDKYYPEIRSFDDIIQPA